MDLTLFIWPKLEFWQSRNKKSQYSCMSKPEDRVLVSRHEGLRPAKWNQQVSMTQCLAPAFSDDTAPSFSANYSYYLTE